MKTLENTVLRPDITYALIAFFVGIVFAFVMPPCAIPDEPAHFIRINGFAHNISGGNSEVKLPDMSSYCNLCEEVGVNSYRHDIGPMVINFFRAGGAVQTDHWESAYSPIAYLPAILVVKLLILVKASMPIHLYAARTAIFVSSVLITWLGIRIIPICGHQWIITFLALLPSRLSQMASISPDSITAALATFWIALILRLVTQKDRASWKMLMLVGVVAVAVAFSKPMYIPLLFLILAVPVSKITDHSILARCFIGFILVFALFQINTIIKRSTIMTALTVPSTASVTVNADAHMAGFDPFFVGNVNRSVQFAQVCQDPVGFLKVLQTTYSMHGHLVYKGVIGLFGWVNVPLAAKWYQFSYLLVFLMFVFGGCINIGARFRIVAISIFLFSLVLIPLALYVGHSPVGSPVIQGVMGRYYVPFVPLLFLALGLPFSSARWTPRIITAVLLGILLLLLVSVITIIKAYYLQPPTAATLQIMAKSNVNGMSHLYIKADEWRGWRKDGIINLLASEGPLKYEFRLPAGFIREIAFAVGSNKDMTFDISSIKIVDLAGVPKKDIEVSKVNISSEPKSPIINDSSGGRLLRVKANGVAPLITIQDINTQLIPPHKSAR